MRRGFLKEVVSLALVLAVLLSFSSPCLAGTPIRKISRGIANTVTGVLELPMKIVEVTEEEGYIAGATYGVMKGLGWAVLRTLVGVYETVTFVVPFPLHYDPIIEPEFLLSEEY